MADPNLHENGMTCPSCELRREEVNKQIGGKVKVPCNQCGGTGRIAFAESQIVQTSANWARVHYWPERERRWAIQNGETR